MEIYDVWIQAKSIRQSAVDSPSSFGPVNAEIAALPEQPNPDMLRPLMQQTGLDSDIRCDECGQTVNRVIRFNEQNDYRWMDICGACLLQALQLHDGK